MEVKELLKLYIGPYGNDSIEIGYDGEEYNEEWHGDLTIRRFYPDHEITIYDGIIIIKDKIVIITEE